MIDGLSKLDGKTVWDARVMSRSYIQVLFEDKSVLHCSVNSDNTLNIKLIEPTLTVNVIPVGTNTLGDGSV